MKFSKIGLLCGAASIGFVVAPASAQDPAQPASASPAPTAAAPAAPGASGDIIVTARRVNERLQDVPIAVTVLPPTVLNSKGVFTPVDLQKNTPGLAVSATVSDRNNVTYTIRGQGFSYGTLFPAVVTYFNEVPITQLTTGQFFDLSNVQILRGPQGVNFGRVTDGGNVMVTPQLPKNEFGGYLDLKYGNYNSKTANGAINIPIVEDRILFRGAFEISRRDGFTENLATGQDLDNVAYESYRGSLTLKPTDTLRNDTVVSYQRTHDNGTGVVAGGVNVAALTANVAGLFSPLAFGTLYGIDARGNVVPAAPGLTPLTADNYLASYQAQVAAQQARGTRKVFYDDPSFDKRKNLFIVNTTTADLSDNIQLKNVFGYVNVQDDEASTYTGVNGGGITTCHSACAGIGGNGIGGLPFNSQEQFSEELRLAGKAFNNNLTYAVGVYADEQRPGKPFENDTINVGILERDGVSLAKTTSRAVYGSAEYDLGALLPGLKVNGGVRYTEDKVHSRTVTYLRPIYYPGVFAPIPHGQCTSYAGPLGEEDCLDQKAKFHATTWTGGISYKVQNGPLFYAKYSKGYRPGGVNTTSGPDGTAPLYQPEYDKSFELGAKADFRLGGEARLTTDLALYSDRYSNIQKLVSLTGPGGAPVSLTTNVANATIKGVEFETTLIPFRGLSIGGTLAYTDAKYKRGGYVAGGATDPCDNTVALNEGFCPFNKFNDTPKWQYTLNGSYDLPVPDSVGKVTVSANYYHQSSVALIDSSVLDPHAIQKSYGLLDANLTWANVMQLPVDLSFFATNITKQKYLVGANDLEHRASFGTIGYIYGAPRFYGVSLKYRFGSDARR